MNKKFKELIVMHITPNPFVLFFYSSTDYGTQLCPSSCPEQVAEKSKCHWMGGTLSSQLCFVEFFPFVKVCGLYSTGLKFSLKEFVYTRKPKFNTGGNACYYNESRKQN